MSNPFVEETWPEGKDLDTENLEGLEGRVKTAFDSVATTAELPDLVDGYVETSPTVSELIQRVRPQGGTIMQAGDSNSNNGWTAGRPAHIGDDRAFLVGAVLRSKGALTLYQPPGLNVGPSRSTGGLTSSQILTKHIPEVIAARPSICAVLAGTNDRPDLSSDISALKANLTAMYDQLLAAGILPVACTLPPRGSNGAGVGAVCGAFNNTHANAWIRRTARERGLPLADFHKVLSDPATYGDWVAGANTTNDNVHHGNVGGKLMSDELWRALAPFLGPDPVVPLADTNVAKSASEAVDLLKTVTGNSLFLTDTNADGIANGWEVLTGSGTPSIADSASVGKFQKLTRGASDYWLRNANAVPMALPTPGDRLLVAFEVESTVKGVGGSMEFRLQMADAANTILAGFVLTEDIPAGSVYAVELTVPPLPEGTTANTWYPTFRFGAKGASGAIAKVGRAVVLNLTAGRVMEESELPPIVTPAQVTGLAASNPSAWRVWLEWNAVSGATFYQVNYRVQGAGSWTTGPVATSPTISVGGLTASTTYEFQVIAYNASGPGAASSTVTQATTATALLLDAVGVSAWRATGLRKLRSAYTGPCIRVRRSNDDAEQDIAFSGNDMDTSALTTFVGSNSGFVVTEYDQSGNGRHVTHATAANQPRIVNAGTIDVVNTKPSLFLDGVNDSLGSTTVGLYAAGNISALTVAKATSGTTMTLWGEGSTTGSGKVVNYAQANGSATLAVFNDAGERTVLGAGGVLASGSLVQQSLVEGASTLQFWIDGVPSIVASKSRSGVVTVDRSNIGAAHYASATPGAVWSGNISEVVLFAASLTDVQRSAGADSQKAHYGTA